MANAVEIDGSAEPFHPVREFGRSLAYLRRGIGEMFLLLGLFAVYESARLLGGRDVPATFRHARDLLGVERLLTCPASSDCRPRC